MVRNSFRARLIVGAVLWISVGLLLSGLVLSQLFEELVVRQVDHDLTDHAEELRSLLERRPDGTLAAPRALSDPRFAVPGFRALLAGRRWQRPGLALAFRCRTTRCPSMPPTWIGRRSW
jgi:hypothetical protein